MKKKDIVLIISTLLFSALFYKEFFGINFFLFSIILCGVTVLLKPELTKSKLWVFAAIITLAGGLAIFMNSTYLSVISWIIAASYLAGVSASYNASPGTGVSYAVFSYFTSIGFMFVDMLERTNRRDRAKKRKFNLTAIFTMSVFIIIVVLVFFFMYQKANPLFKEITKFINLDFLSFQWIMFTLWGFVMMYGFIYVRYIRKIDAYETLSPKYLSKEATAIKPNKFLWFTIDESIELKAGIILFLFLNIMIFTINILDISYLWSGVKLPEGFTFAGYLHQGIYTLIFSSILAILLILFVFRGKLNFIEKNKYLKILAYVWIAQNILISVSCAYRNMIYISNYALTYKRVTIFILLFLVIIGLITAIVKIYKAKNIYFLYRVNSFVIIAVLVFTSLINWDKIITKYNLEHSKNPDISYLSSLNHSGIPYLLEYIDEVFSDEDKTEDLLHTSDLYFDDYNTIENKVYNKAYILLERRHNYGWQSFNLSVDRTISKINEMYKEGSLNRFVLRNKTKFDISPLKEFSEIKSLTLNNVRSENTFNPEDLSVFTKLNELKLINMKLDSIGRLPAFEHLESVDFSNNRIDEFRKLSEYNGLRSVKVSNNPLSDISFLKDIPEVELLNISRTDVKDLSAISSLSNLKSLSISDMKEADFSTLPECKNLIEIDLSNNNDLYIYQNIPIVISNAPNLEKAHLRSVSISSLKFFSNPIVKLRRKLSVTSASVDSDILENITYLDVAGNNLANLIGIEVFKGLKVLNASSNKIRDISSISKIPYIEELNLQKNPIESLDGLENLKSLKSLHLSGFTFTNIDVIGNLDSLSSLTLSYGHISDTKALEQLSELKYLDLSKSSISSLDFLSNMKSLEVLDLSNYQGNDIEKVIQCSNLSVVILPVISHNLQKRIEEEIPQIKVIWDYDYQDRHFYMFKYR